MGALDNKYIIKKELITKEESEILMALEEYSTNSTEIKGFCLYPCFGLRIDNIDRNYFPKEAIYLDREKVNILICLICTGISLDKAIITIYGENNG